MKSTSNLLILTIGTGTKGDHSNLAQGMITTILRLNPRLYWLVPSESPDSTAVADLVRDAAVGEASFHPWSQGSPYARISEPDDLFTCRKVLREVIQAAKRQLKKGEELWVNPTSGTKQMSAAATLAALEAEIGRIVFTVGERQDGVVKTGTERLRDFNTRRFFVERTWKEAARLIHCGAYKGASALLEAFQPELKIHLEAAQCLHEWQRLNFEGARQIAARSEAEELQPCRPCLDRLAKSDALSVERLGELLASADALAGWGECEEALARYYRGTEMAAQIRLAEGYEVRPPYGEDELCRISRRLSKKWQGRGRDIPLGLGDAMGILKELKDGLGDDYQRNRDLKDLLALRNKSFLGHGTAQIEPKHVTEAAGLLQQLLTDHLENLETYWTLGARPSFPALPKE